MPGEVKADTVPITPSEILPDGRAWIDTAQLVGGRRDPAETIADRYDVLSFSDISDEVGIPQTLGVVCVSRAQAKERLEELERKGTHSVPVKPRKPPVLHLVVRTDSPEFEILADGTLVRYKLVADESIVSRLGGDDAMPNLGDEALQVALAAADPHAGESVIRSFEPHLDEHGHPTFNPSPLPTGKTN